MINRVAVGAFFAGFVSLVIGAFMVYRPAGFIVCGALLMIAGVKASEN